MVLGLTMLVFRFKQVTEQRPVVDHRLTQVLRGRFSFGMLVGDFPRGAVIHHDISVINRHVCDALLEVADRIPARGHDFSNQPIGLGHGTTWVVDEARLNGSPGTIESLGVS